MRKFKKPAPGRKQKRVAPRDRASWNFRVQQAETIRQFDPDECRPSTREIHLMTDEERNIL